MLRRWVIRDLSQLLVYTVDRHCKFWNADDLPYAFFQAVLDRQADLVSRWMLVGFVHGVMNTDNISIAGETIDYGPCAFLCLSSGDGVGSIDHQGRYALSESTVNHSVELARLAESLVQIVPEPEDGWKVCRNSGNILLLLREILSTECSTSLVLQPWRTKTLQSMVIY